MKAKVYSKHNFHKHTFAIWKEVPYARISDLKISYVSQSGSQYIFTPEGLYRVSNHWGRVANCHWRLIPLSEFKSQHTIVGYAKWADFYSNDDSAKLFFIKIDFDTNEVNFYHKESSDINEQLVFRNARDTAKTIRTIKEVLNETHWAKHLNYENLDVLRKQIISDLIDSKKSFLDIKKAYL